MPVSDDELFTPNDILRSKPPDDEDLVSLSDLTGGIPAASNMAQGWAELDMNEGKATKDNYMEQAGARIQEYQQSRLKAGDANLTANEQVAIVDAYRQMAGLQPEGYFLTPTGAAVPQNIFQEIRRKRVEDSDWENFKSNVSSTVLGNLAAIRAAQAKVTDSLGITDDALAEASRQAEEVNAILQPGGGKAGFMGRAIGNVMNLFLAGGQAPAMFATSTAGYTFIDVNRRRQGGQDISPTAEWTAAICNAGIEYAMESFGQLVAQKAGAVLGNHVNTIRRAVVAGGARGGIRTAAATLAHFGLQSVGLAIEGATEEGVTEILQNTTRRLAYAPEQKIFANTGEAALQGAIMPLLAAPGMAAIQAGKPGGRFRPDSGKPSKPLGPPGDVYQEATFRLKAMAEARLASAEALTSLVGVEEAARAEKTLPDNLQIAVPAVADIPSGLNGGPISQNALFLTWIGSREVSEKAATISAINKHTALKKLVRDGETREQVDLAMFTYVQMKENPEAYSAENIADQIPEGMVDQVLTNVEMARNLSPEQQAFAEKVIVENHELGLEGMEAGILGNLKDSYAAIIWNVGRGAKKAKFTISTDRARHRSLPSLIEGWSQGLTLAVPSLIDSQMVARQQLSQTIFDRNFAKAGIKSEIFSMKRDETHTHEVKHPNFAQWIPAGKVGMGIAAAEGEAGGVEGEAVVEAGPPAVGKPGKVTLPEGWDAAVQPFWQQPPGWKSAIDWKGKRIVFETKRDLTTPYTMRQVTATVLVKAMPDATREAFVAEYTEVAGMTAWEIQNKVQQEKLTKDIESYLDDRTKVSPEVAAVLDKFLKRQGRGMEGEAADAAEGAEGKPAKVWAGDLFLDSTGTLFKRSTIYADKKTARHLNNALGSSTLYNIPGVGKVTQFTQGTKHLILTASLFHPQAFLRSFVLGSRGVDPVTAYREGRTAIENFIPEFQELTFGGLTTFEARDMTYAQKRETSKIMDAIDKVPMAGSISRALKSIGRANVKFVFGKLGAYWKAQAALLEYRAQLKHHEADLLSGKITREELARQTADLINDDFGDLNLMRMGRNPTLQHMFRLVALAADWTESNVRSMVKASKRGHAGQMYRAMWGRILLKGLGSTLIFNLMMSGLDEDKDFLDRYDHAWKSGNLRWLDADITPIYRALGGDKGKRKYFSVLGHFKDPPKFVTQSVRSAKNKSSVLGRMVLDALTGTDWRGREYTSLGELMRSGDAVKSIPFGGGPITPGQYPSYIVKQAEQTTPVQAQSMIQWLRGEIDGFDAITRAAGMMTSGTRAKTGKRKKRARRKRSR